MSLSERRRLAHPGAVRALLGGHPPGSPQCPVCRTAPLTARQEVCSGRCRAARSRQRKAAARRGRDAEIRALLEAALEKLKEHP
jgi:predicted nucleic acid-binding Zn ribbon protein